MQTLRITLALILLPFFFSSASQTQELSSLAVDGSQLTSAEVASIIEAAVQADQSTAYYVVVVDHAGRILGAWQKPNATDESAEKALGLARTGAFFSNDQAPLSSRTVRFISGIHFPPGIPYQNVAALYGIENTNRGCALNAQFNPGKDIPQSLSFQSFLTGGLLKCDATDQRGCGIGISTGKYTGSFVDGRWHDIPVDELLDRRPFQVDGGGIPIFKGCKVVGGIGVFGINPDHAEYAALVGSLSGGPSFGPLGCLPEPKEIFLEGIKLPFTATMDRPAGMNPGGLVGQYVVSPRAGGDAADGWIIGGPDRPLQSTELSSGEVQRIVEQSIFEGNRTRAAIRLPIGSRARFAISISDLDGNLIALYRMPDSTFFSVDVATAKARNVVYFSGTPDSRDFVGLRPGLAVSNRTISFAAQPFYPPGIDGTQPGPAFDLFIRDLYNPCSQGYDPRNSPNKSGVVFFPGSLPLYKGGRLVGGLGISGDGVEQDDLVAAAGALGFEAPTAIRANNVYLRGVRLPYLKFPRNPYQ